MAEGCGGRSGESRESAFPRLGWKWVEWGGPAERVGSVWGPVTDRGPENKSCYGGGASAGHHSLGLTVVGGRGRRVARVPGGPRAVGHGP